MTLSPWGMSFQKCACEYKHMYVCEPLPCLFAEMLFHLFCTPVPSSPCWHIELTSARTYITGSWSGQFFSYAVVTHISSLNLCNSPVIDVLTYSKPRGSQILVAWCPSWGQCVVLLILFSFLMAEYLDIICKHCHVFSQSSWVGEGHF